MFTPPPSPGQSPRKDPRDVPPVTDAAMEHPMSPGGLKRRIGRRTRWTVITVPIVLVLITASTRYLTHPAAFDMFSEPPSLNWETLSSRASNWSPHEPHLPVVPRAADTASTLGSLSGSDSLASLTGSSTSAASSVASTSTLPPTSDQTVPTVPPSPPTLPTPFPQPFDSALSQNFSSLSCFNFFSNMTNTVAFRACRPFSLLLQASDAFIQAQDDLDTLTDIVWGTCNTTIDDDQCSVNMAWFSGALEDSCAADLKAGNSMAVNTQIALDAFDLMRNAGCLVDPSTNTYCYVDAVRNSNPSDTYFYSIPLGVSIPNNTIASCSGCTKSLMTLYYAALQNSSEAPSLSALQGAYESAAKVAVADCGSAYATLTTAVAKGGAPPARTLASTFLVLAVALALPLLALL
ncbi:hypothetical protein DFH07DRAFT_839461 [Mycena maculata]|uniref:DUF7729 domain-containing protein n=1 Tax=Mycena maculata TaxID=230809 RepID=A0AAD7ICW8_9AGAR|nr:hypothetical protein DFH07DRAFT_839461 [Mycena maculata]